MDWFHFLNRQDWPGGTLAHQTSTDPTWKIWNLILETTLIVWLGPLWVSLSLFILPCIVFLWKKTFLSRSDAHTTAQQQLKTIKRRTTCMPTSQSICCLHCAQECSTRSPGVLHPSPAAPCISEKIEKHCSAQKLDSRAISWPTNWKQATHWLSQNQISGFVRGNGSRWRAKLPTRWALTVQKVETIHKKQFWMSRTIVVLLHNPHIGAWTAPQKSMDLTLRFFLS